MDPSGASEASERAVTLLRRAAELASTVRGEIVQLAERHRRASGSDQEGLGSQTRKLQLETTQKAFKSALEELFRVEKDARAKTRDRLERQYQLGDTLSAVVTLWLS